MCKGGHKRLPTFSWTTVEIKIHASVKMPGFADVNVKLYQDICSFFFPPLMRSITCTVELKLIVCWSIQKSFRGVRLNFLLCKKHSKSNRLWGCLLCTAPFRSTCRKMQKNLARYGCFSKWEKASVLPPYHIAQIHEDYLPDDHISSCLFINFRGISSLCSPTTKFSPRVHDCLHCVSQCI